MQICLLRVSKNMINFYSTKYILSDLSEKINIKGKNMRKTGI